MMKKKMTVAQVNDALKNSTTLDQLMKVIKLEELSPDVLQHQEKGWFYDSPSVGAKIVDKIFKLAATKNSTEPTKPEAIDFVQKFFEIKGSYALDKEFYEQIHANTKEAVGGGFYNHDLEELMLTAKSAYNSDKLFTAFVNDDEMLLQQELKTGIKLLGDDFDRFKKSFLNDSAKFDITHKVNGDDLGHKILDAFHEVQWDTRKEMEAKRSMFDMHPKTFDWEHTGEYKDHAKQLLKLVQEMDPQAGQERMIMTVAQVNALKNSSILDQLMTVAQVNDALKNSTTLDQLMKVIKLEELSPVLHHKEKGWFYDSPSVGAKIVDKIFKLGAAKNTIEPEAIDFIKNFFNLKWTYGFDKEFYQQIHADMKKTSGLYNADLDNLMLTVKSKDASAKVFSSEGHQQALEKGITLLGDDFDYFKKSFLADTDYFFRYHPKMSRDIAWAHENFERLNDSLHKVESDIEKAMHAKPSISNMNPFDQEHAAEYLNHVNELRKIVETVDPQVQQGTVYEPEHYFYNYNFQDENFRIEDYPDPRDL